MARVAVALPDTDFDPTEFTAPAPPMSSTCQFPLPTRPLPR
jgi:hypothetical protein